MIFESTSIPGAFIVRPERREDERGYFARTWCRDEFLAHGIEVSMLQSSLSLSRRCGTLRGMHYARSPAREGKLVRCESGRVFDVIVDLRADSPAYLTYVGRELDAVDAVAMYVPPGVAHGFLTLSDDCRVFYMMSEAYRPDLASGVRYDDPAIGIRWPQPVRVIAERDRSYPDIEPVASH